MSAATTAASPPWLTIASRYLGVTETPGKDTTPVIRRWLIELGAWWTDDETPWCGVFVAHVMREAGLTRPPHWYRARAWLDWGRALPEPLIGCIAVFERGAGGHVGFVVGRDPMGHLLVLGGNQGDRVSIAAFEPRRALGFMWPGITFAEHFAPPPLVTESIPTSTSEA